MSSSLLYSRSHGLEGRSPTGVPLLSLAPSSGWAGVLSGRGGGKGITYRGAGIPRKWDALRDTDGPGHWEPGYTYDTGPWLSGNGLHLSQDKGDTHIWFNNWRLRCCQAVGGAQERQEYYYYFLAMSRGVWGLSFLIRDGNFTPCLESTRVWTIGPLGKSHEYHLLWHVL